MYLKKKDRKGFALEVIYSHTKWLKDPSNEGFDHPTCQRNSRTYIHGPPSHIVRK